MNIKTLEYIHKLLIEKERKTDEIYKEARRIQHEYEATGKSQDVITRQAQAANSYMQEHIAALKALEDIESHDW